LKGDKAEKKAAKAEKKAAKQEAAETVRELEPFYQVASLEEIEENLPKAAGKRRL